MTNSGEIGIGGGIAGNCELARGRASARARARARAGRQSAASVGGGDTTEAILGAVVAGSGSQVPARNGSPSAQGDRGYMAAQGGAQRTPRADCTICLESLDPEGSARPVVNLSCSHGFHLDCIGNTFNASSAGGGAVRCPLCRAEQAFEWHSTAHFAAVAQTEQMAQAREAEDLLPADGDDRDSEDEWDDFCGVCGVGGELLCCDGCSFAVHRACVGLDANPRT
eukprot:SAG11_NODE_667_length_7841_cov_19.517954_5_plen_225_part_00